MTPCYILHLHSGYFADAFDPSTYGGLVNGYIWKIRPVCHLCVHQDADMITE